MPWRRPRARSAGRHASGQDAGVPIRAPPPRRRRPRWPRRQPRRRPRRDQDATAADGDPPTTTPEPADSRWSGKKAAREGDRSRKEGPCAGGRPEKKAPAKAAAPKARPPKKQLTAAQVELRDRIRRTLAVQYQQPFNTRDNTAADLIKFCWAFGCQSEVERGDAPGQKVNAITCLCWDLPCGGYHVLAAGRRPHCRPRRLRSARRSCRSSWRCWRWPTSPSTTRSAPGETTRTVADLVESEKLTCRAGADMSLKLIGLSHYVEQATWKNSLDEPWSIEQIVA